MFLVVLFYVAIYTALTERYSASLLIMMPAFLVYFLVAGLQYNVGTDYYSYVHIFDDEASHQYYYDRKEYLFSYLNSILNKINLPSQSVFLVISFIQSIFIFSYFKEIKGKGLIVSIFFIVFFCVSNIYNNQLNGLRQYVVIAALPLLTIYIGDGKYMKFLFLLIVSALFHNTAWFLLFLVPLYFFSMYIKKGLMALFFLSAPFYLFLGTALNKLVDVFLSGYAHYLQGEYAEQQTIFLFITKLYYLPLFLFFFIFYKRSESSVGKYFHFMVVTFSLTYWFFLLSLYLGIATRFYYYLVFFMIFPIYYLLHKSYKEGRVIFFVFILVYIVGPYVAKVTFLARAEFLYQSILWR